MTAPGADTAVPARAVRWRVLAATSFTTFISTINSSALNVALPSIMRDLRTGFAEVQWVIVIYLLSVTASLLVFGKIADALGRGRVNLIGVAIFAAGSLGCGLSTGIWLLIAARGVQALGAAMMMATGPAILADVFPPQDRGSALGLQGTAVALGLTLGPPVGGLLMDALTYRAIFLLNVPLAIAAFAFLWHALPPDRPSAAQGPFDRAGGVLWIAGLSALLMLVLHGREWGLSDPKSLFAIAVMAICLPAFVVHEMRAAAPLLSLALLGRGGFSAGLAAAFLSYVVSFMATFIMPFYLDHVRGAGPPVMGIVMSALPLALLLVSGPAGWASDRWGTRAPTVLGLLLVAAGLLVCARIDDASEIAAVFAGLFVLGAGMGIFQSPNTSALLGVGGHAAHGEVSSLLATVRNMGMAIGIALGGALFAWRFAAATGGGTLDTFTPAQSAGFTDAMRLTFFVAAALALLATAPSSLRGAPPKER